MRNRITNATAGALSLLVITAFAPQWGCGSSELAEQEPGDERVAEGEDGLWLCVNSASTVTLACPGSACGGRCSSLRTCQYGAAGDDYCHYALSSYSCLTARGTPTLRCNYLRDDVHFINGKQCPSTEAYSTACY
jgi:hypothetical protein